MAEKRSWTVVTFKQKFFTGILEKISRKGQNTKAFLSLNQQRFISIIFDIVLWIV